MPRSRLARDRPGLAFEAQKLRRTGRTAPSPARTVLYAVRTGSQRAAEAHCVLFVEKTGAVLERRCTEPDAGLSRLGNVRGARSASAGRRTGRTGRIRIVIVHYVVCRDWYLIGEFEYQLKLMREGAVRPQ